MLNARDVELMAVRSAFCSMVARWRLGQAEVALVLGLAGGAWHRDVVLPDVLDVDGETRMRLLVRLDRWLSTVIVDDGDVADWIRTPSAEVDGTVPLSLVADLRQLRALVAAAEAARDGGRVP